MLLFTRLFVYLQYKNIIIIVTIVVFSNLKGGVGKNTLSLTESNIHLSCYTY